MQMVKFVTHTQQIWSNIINKNRNPWLTFKWCNSPVYIEQSRGSYWNVSEGTNRSSFYIFSRWLRLQEIFFLFRVYVKSSKSRYIYCIYTVCVLIMCVLLQSVNMSEPDTERSWETPANETPETKQVCVDDGNIDIFPNVRSILL